MNKLLGLIYLGVSIIFSSCAITMTGPTSQDSLPLVFKINIGESDFDNFVMVSEAVDGVDDATLEEMRAATLATKALVEPDFYQDNFYLVFENTEYEAGIFIIEYAATGSFVKFMDVDLKTGIASNNEKSVSITSEFSSDYRTVTVSMVRSEIEGFYVSKDKSFLFNKENPSSSKTLSIVKSQIFKTKDGIHYSLDGDRVIDTTDLTFDSTGGYVPYAILYFNPGNSPFEIYSNLILLIFSRPGAEGFELCFIQLNPEDKFMNIRNYPDTGVNTFIDVKIGANYENMLLLWKWMHVS